MNLRDLFSSREHREQLSHLRNLLTVAFADGRIDKREMAGIAAIMARDNISDADLKRCLDNPESIDFVAPNDDAQKVQYLHDMVALMMVDGNIADKEMLVCKATAEALGFRQEVIDAMIFGIIEELGKKIESRRK